ncbi:MAG: MarR family winged helix-turn-helix transcriptional regulator [Oscillospiraceae bacterium]
MHPNWDIEPDDESRLAHSLMSEIRRLQKSWTGMHPKPPITRGDLSMMHTIARLSVKGRPTIGEIAKATNQSVPGVSRRVAELEKTGFVKRYADEKDRRVSYIQISEKGKKKGEAAFEMVKANLQLALKEIGTERAEEMIKMLHEFGIALENASKTLSEGEKHK